MEHLQYIQNEQIIQMSFIKLTSHRSTSPINKYSRNTKVDDNNQQLQSSTIQNMFESANSENLLKYFEEYRPHNPVVVMDELLNSQIVKLKKYKQSIYYGEMINYRKHGRGIMIYNSNKFYEGEWVDDLKHGVGYEQFANRCVYQGDYAKGKPEGIGKYTWPNGQYYQGQWVDGFKHGSGMWRGTEGDSYIGEWKNGKVDGYGIHVWSNGDNYEGQFKECLKHGEGIEKFANGDIYKGSYMNGKPNGYGEYFWANGSYYKGNFKNGLRDGNGLWKKNTGQSDKYQGEYANDKKNGYGVFTWASGNFYSGNYQGDVRQGYGQMKWNDGSIYKGSWKKGLQHGKGDLFVPNKGWKRGIFQNNALIIVKQEWQENLNEQNQEQEVEEHEVSDHQSEFLNQFQHSTPIGLKGFTQPKYEFRTRQISTSSKNRPRKVISIEEKQFPRFKKSESTSQPKNRYKFRKDAPKIQIKQQTNKKGPKLEIFKNNMKQEKPKKQTRQLKTLSPKKQPKEQKKILTPKQEIQNYYTLLPKPQLKLRQTKYLTLDRRILKVKQSGKEKLLHSSFYLHRMKKRESVSAEGGRTVSREVVRRDVIDEMGISSSTSKWVKQPTVD